MEEQAQHLGTAVAIFRTDTGTAPAIALHARAVVPAPRAVAAARSAPREPAVAGGDWQTF
ncbi:hypothetical protein D3C72_2320690 [compost metagenome]